MKRTLISFICLLAAVSLLTGFSVPVYAEGSAPVAENLELKTYRNVSVGGNMEAYDPDGDVVSFEITTRPRKGEIELGDDGKFIYTPKEDKKGRDYFGYKALDSQGNYSQEATVIIKIEKQKKDVMYSDMKGSADEYAAISLAEAGIFVGEQIGGNYCFNPEKAVSRGEFLSMCMMLSDEPILNSVLSTGYSDDEAIPQWMKSYVATAAMCGIESGAMAEDGPCFDASAPISDSEAASMLNKAMNITEVSYISFGDVDMEYAQACANLSACGLITEGTLIKDELSRGEAARMLSAAIDLKDRRTGTGV